MNHDDIKILISAYIDGEVTPSEKNIVEDHLSSCPECQQDYKKYMALASSLSKWPNENLSPDEEINVQKRLFQRREPMFTNRTTTVLITTLCLAIVIGSVIHITKPIQGGLKSSSDNIADQYSQGNTNTMMYETQYEPYYMASNFQNNPASGETKFYDAANNLPAASMANPAYAPRMMYMTNGAYVRSMNAPAWALVGSLHYSNTPLNYQSKVKNTARVGLFVSDADKAQSDLETIVSSHKGIIVNSQFNKSTEDRMVPGQHSNDWTYTSSGTIEFTVPPQDLQKVILEIRKLGQVIFENQNGEDVTEVYLQAQHHLENDQDIMQRFHKILERSIHQANGVDTIDNAQTMEAEVESLQNTIEQDKLALTQTDMATVNVTYYEKNNDPFYMVKSNWTTILNHSYEGFVNSWGRMIVLLSSLLPLVIVIAIVLWLLISIVKKYMKK